VRIFAATRPVPASAQTDGLVRRVRENHCDPFTGNLFCFFNRHRTRVKLLVWDGNGFWIFSKRLERGRFERLDSRAPWMELSREQLVMMLAGIDTKRSRFRRHFVREVRIESRADDVRARAAQ
jgi:transposase